jgi:hypothetical protein
MTFQAGADHVRSSQYASPSGQVLSGEAKFFFAECMAVSA